jgi:hypothetical protein
VYNNQPMDQASAELFCNTQGGHLASYNSSAEQREVRAAPLPAQHPGHARRAAGPVQQRRCSRPAGPEGTPRQPCTSSPPHPPNRPHPPLLPQVESYIVSKGLLLPLFHKTYWIGYSSDSTKWPLFKPADATVLPLTDPKAYNHFGLMRFTNLSLSARAEPNNYFGAAAKLGRVARGAASARAACRPCPGACRSCLTARRAPQAPSTVRWATPARRMWAPGAGPTSPAAARTP